MEKPDKHMYPETALKQHFTSGIFLRKTHNPSNHVKNIKQIWIGGILQNTWALFLKTVKFIFDNKNKEVWENRKEPWRDMITKYNMVLEQEKKRH